MRSCKLGSIADTFSPKQGHRLHKVQYYTTLYLEHSTLTYITPATTLPEPHPLSITCVVSLFYYSKEECGLEMSQGIISAQ